MARVYVSSTIADLEAERRAVMDWLVAGQHQLVHSYQPSSETVRDGCLDDVGTCDLYVLILGHRYGFQPLKDNPGGLSITQLEFRRAGEVGIPRVALLRTSIPDVSLSDIEDPQKWAKVRAFRDEVARDVRPAEFQDQSGLLEGLSTGIPAALAGLSARRRRGIFLSYRREDTGPYAVLLQGSLRERFPDSRVFMDLDSINAGVNFSAAIQDAVGSSAVLVVLIGRQWATLADEQGRRRLDDPGDYVCFELRTALAHRVRVIPVLIDGTEPLRQEQLPAELEELVQLQAVELSYARYDYDAGRLLEQIQRVLPAADDPVPAGHQVAAGAHQARQEAEPQATESGRGGISAAHAAAIDLGSDNADVRVRGIYALERISGESASDYRAVMERLATFVREHSHVQWPAAAGARGPDGQAWFRRLFAPRRVRPQPAVVPEPKTRPDVQAAMSVIGRRTPGHDSEAGPVDLSGVDLRGAILRGANLASVDLSGADLSGANLNAASLGRANLSRARLEDATLDRADLHGAQLYEANLRDALLTRADLTGADLTRTDLTRARLSKANLDGAHLTGADLTDAELTDAKWPEDAAVPDGWQRQAASPGLTKAGSNPEDWVYS